MCARSHKTHSSGSLDLGTAQQHEHDEVEVLLPAQNLDSSSPVRRAHAAKPFTSFSVQSQQEDSTSVLDENAVFDSQRQNLLDTGCDSNSSGSSHTKAVLCLCGAHALARWGWRTWEFAVALILIKLFPTSLLLVSVYGLLDNIVRLVFGSVIGQFVDRTERLRGALACYGIQNICIAISAAAAAALVLLDMAETGTLQARQPALYWVIISITLVAGASSSIGSLGATVAVEREYATTLCGDDSTALRKLNASLRAIDLLSQMLGPVASGLLMSYSSMLSAIVVLALYSLGAWVPEALLLQAARRHSYRLRQPKPLLAGSQQQRPNVLKVVLGSSGWVAYFQQTTVLPGLALALLYLTVLSLGFLMTSFLAWQGMSSATISLFRSAGALSGLMATIMFHPLQQCGVELVGAGSLGISWQLTWLLVGVTPVVVAQAWGHQLTSPVLPFNTVGALTQSASPQPSVSPSPHGVAASGPGVLPHRLLYVLLLGLVASRFGLWLFDLAVTQLQQESVPETELGTVSGVQASLQSAFEVVSFLAGAVINQPQHFHWLMTGSCGAVGLAAILYWTYAGSAAGGRTQLQLLPKWCSSLLAQGYRQGHSADGTDRGARSVLAEAGTAMVHPKPGSSS